MYHQFKELGNLDITSEPMEVGPTTHYVMGGVRVDADSQMTCVPGLFAAGECAAGINGANRLGGNSLSDLLVFGKLAGEYAAKYAKDKSLPSINNSQIEMAERRVLEPFDRPTGGENPFVIQQDLQNKMQDLVGIVRKESEMQQALVEIQRFWQRQARAGVEGNRMYNPGWNTLIDLYNLLTVSEAITLSGLIRKESRGGHFREDYPSKNDAQGKVNTVVRKAPDGKMQIEQVPIPPMPAELQKVIEEMK
jgi:succinate dehydrogenase / fumarate reductase flavoprotein subunit